MPIKDPRNRKLPPARLEQAQNAFTAMKQLKDYNPSRKEFSVENAAEKHNNQQKAEEDEIAAQNAWNKARDKRDDEDWALYDMMQGVAEQVLGQYGSDSDEYASLGYKKKSEYKKAAAKTKKAE